MDNLVYLLEDDDGIKDVVECALSIASIDVKCFATINEFKQAIQRVKPALVLLDIMLPDGNGLDVLKYLKANYPGIICIMLSALGQEIDKVKGLNAGADDYISKPFGTLELTARVQAALRRNNAPSYHLNGLSVNKKTREVFLNDHLLELNNKEFQLLVYFLDNQNVVISRDRLLEAVWGYEGGETRTIDNHILRLRKLGITQIETVFGVGYKFVSR